MARKRQDRSAEATYGVEAELERLMRCPECGAILLRFKV